MEFSESINRSILDFFRKRTVLLSVFLILVLNLLLKKILGVNENVVLAEARHFGDPSWIPNDWFLNQHIGYRLLFNTIFGYTARFLPLHLLSISGRILIYFIFSIIVDKAARTLKIHVLFIIPSMLLFILFQSLVAREWMLGGLETKSFAYACALGALIALAHRRYKPMFLLTGLAASFHILVGIYSAFSLGVAILTLKEQRENFRQIIISSPLALITAIPALYAIFQYLGDSATVDSVRAAAIYVIKRNPHHVFPAAWTKPWTVRFIASCLFFITVLCFSRVQERRIFASYGLGSAVLFCTGLVLYYTGNYNWLKLYWFRHPDVIIPFIGFFLTASLLSVPIIDLSPDRKAGPVKSLSSLLRKATIALGIILSLTAIGKSLFTFRDQLSFIIQSNSPFYLDNLNPELREALFWIKAKTPGNSSFLVSPAVDQFYIAAERGMFVSFKHSPQTDSDNIEWYNRILLLNNGNEPVKNGFHMVTEIDDAFYRISPDLIRSLAEKYSLDYLLTKYDFTMPFTKVYSNSIYALYKINDGNP